MDIRPIRTEADYEAALVAIERLFDAVPNTPEGERLALGTPLEGVDFACFTQTSKGSV